MTYEESKKKIDKIRREYGCAGEVIFRVALQNLIDYGKCTLLDKGWYGPTMNEIDQRHDNAEANGKCLIMTREFEKAIVDCSVALCDVETYDLLIYIQKEVWLGGNGISYERAIELLKSTLDHCDTFEWEAHNEANYCGFTDDEIEELGYGYLLETDGDEDMDDDEEEE